MKLTEKDYQAVRIYISMYSTHRDFSAKDWFDAANRVHGSEKLQEYIKKMVK